MQQPSKTFQPLFKKSLKLSSLSALIGASLLLACSSEDTVQSAGSSNGSEAQLRVQEDTQSVWVRFVDAITGEQITEELDVKLTDEVVTEDASGRSISNGSLTVTDGEAFLTADFEDKERFSVLVGNTASGYLETGQQIGAGGDLKIDQPQDIPVLRFTDEAIASLKASGLAIGMEKVTVTANSDGSIPAVDLSTEGKSFVVSGLTNADGSAVVKQMGVASIQIEPGTQALDRNGNPIPLNGDLTVVAVYYNPQQDESLSLYPGGFSTPVENLPASLPDSGEGVFISGGFAQFNILTSNGTALTRFDRPLRLSIDMPKDIINLDTNEAYKPGDQFPVFSYEESTGVWTFEQMGLIQDKVNDQFNYNVQFLSTHLTAFNLDSYTAQCSIDVIHDRSKYYLEFRGTSWAPFLIFESVARRPNRRTQATRSTQYFLPNINPNANIIQLVFGFGNVVREARIQFKRHGTGQLAREIPLQAGYCGQTYTMDPPPVDVDFTFNLTETQSCSESTDGVLTRVQLYTGTGSGESLYRAVSSSASNVWTPSGQSQRLSLSATFPSSVAISRLNVQKFVDGSWVDVGSLRPANGGTGQRNFDISWTANDGSVCLERGSAFQ